MEDVIDLRDYGISMASLHNNLKQRYHRGENLYNKFITTRIVQIEVKNRIDSKHKKSFRQGHKVSLIKRERA